jgi:hypothetical protein
MYSEMFARSRGQGLLFVNLVRRVRCDPPQDTVQSDQQSMGSGAAISPPGFDAKTMHRLSAPLPQTGYDAPACKTNVQDGDGRDDVNEGIDDGSMLGQIEGRELLDMVGHVAGLEQGFILQR